MAKTKTAKKKPKSGKKQKKENAIKRYLRETRAELRKVHWPTRQEALNLTKVVMGVTVSMSLFLGLLDRLFALGLGGVISGDAIAIGSVVGVTVVSIVVIVILNRRTA
ncbi:MAG: preprotein translocase subunit SecE [Chloroflexota bacterium]|nr:preprotein translocase subunit SecE [Chloroflexota bacterium]